MSRVKLHGTVVFFALVLWSAVASAWEGMVVQVLDGDSIRVRQGEQLVTLRLYGIDCPEYGQPYWREAKNATSQLVQKQRVAVQPIETDQYGRIVALVEIRGQLVNEELVRRGLAWVYPRYCKAQPLCRRLDASEQAARSQRLGLWRDRRPMPPWVWKHSQR